MSCPYNGYTHNLVLPCFQNYMERIQFSSWTITSIFNSSIYFSLLSSWISRKKKKNPIWIHCNQLYLSSTLFPSRFTTGLRNIANINLNLMFVGVRVRACGLVSTRAPYFTGTDVVPARYSHTNRKSKILSKVIQRGQDIKHSARQGCIKFCWTSKRITLLNDVTLVGSKLIDSMEKWPSLEITQKIRRLLWKSYVCGRR
jgi:hypothetical protein